METELLITAFITLWLLAGGCLVEEMNSKFEFEYNWEKILLFVAWPVIYTAAVVWAGVDWVKGKA